MTQSDQEGNSAVARDQQRLKEKSVQEESKEVQHRRHSINEQVGCQTLKVANQSIGPRFYKKEKVVLEKTPYSVDIGHFYAHFSLYLSFIAI